MFNFNHLIHLSILTKVYEKFILLEFHKLFMFLPCSYLWIFCILHIISHLTEPYVILNLPSSSELILGKTISSIHLPYLSGIQIILSLCCLRAEVLHIASFETISSINHTNWYHHAPKHPRFLIFHLLCTRKTSTTQRPSLHTLPWSAAPILAHGIL